ncbi:MAG: hypothetical protein PHR77_13430 [Kiritimatiellae bacterium]|nr:hypothetical protein [Kiritimatiellia bacterium]MDD5519698.1 hypothetical protein [Kiritimatiellia bacterium]
MLNSIKNRFNLTLNLKTRISRFALLSALGFVLGFVPLSVDAADLRVGVATADITPTGPVALWGQFHLRISQSNETPLTANIVVLESCAGDKSLDSAVMVSCDVVAIPDEVLAQVRKEVAKRLPELDTKKIFLNATHTHTAPVLSTDGWYVIPKDGVIQVKEYVAFFADRIAGAIVQAWNKRKPGSVTWGLGHAVVAYNRRAVYADGSARMYGKTNLPEFRNIEGYEDHDIGTLFFWNADGKLIGMVVNISCTTQEVESRNAVNADFWHNARERLHQRYGSDVCIVSWVGAAGDQSPHLMYRKAADERMVRLRGLTRMEEIARRIERAVDEAYEAVKNDRHTDVPLIHQVKTIRLPMRLVTEAEYAEAKVAYQKAADQIDKDPKAAERENGRKVFNQLTVQRFEAQKADPKPTYEMELHVLRIGDIAVCTSPFELFTEYGIRIKARSKAVQTFVVQLVGHGWYLPTEAAVRGGHYSAIINSNLVGPEGGQILVDSTVDVINGMWK